MSNRIELTRWLVGHTKKLLAPLTVSALARIMWQLLDTAILVIAAFAIIDLVSGSQPHLVRLVIVLIVAALLKALLRYLEQYAGHYVAFRALLSLRILLFDKLVPQAPAATQGKASGDLTERATRDIDRIEVFFAHTPVPAVSAIVVPIIGSLWFAASGNPLLALVVWIGAVIATIIPVLAGKTTWQAAADAAHRRGEVSAHIGDDIYGIREVLGFAARKHRLAALDERGQFLSAAASRVGLIQGLRTGAVYAVQALSLIAIVIFAHDAAAAIVGVALAASLWKPVRGIDEFTAGLDAAFAATERVRDVVDAPPMVLSPAVAKPFPSGNNIEFRDVSFSYPVTERDALSEISTQITADSWTCIVGVSGSGKSTLGSLILRAWDPGNGQVLLGGVDVRELDLDLLRSVIGLVPQRPVLLSGTVADNLRLAAPDATDEELLSALNIAGLGHWVSDREHGLAAKVSAGGGEVSGGELQRLAVARALVARPRVLILDEALSQLDAHTAREVRRNLAALHLTVIEITHRADLIADSTPVIVLDGGVLLENGDAGELRAQESAFNRVEARA